MFYGAYSMDTYINSNNNMKIKFILDNNQFTEEATVTQWITKNEAYAKWPSGQGAYIHLKDENRIWVKVSQNVRG